MARGTGQRRVTPPSAAHSNASALYASQPLQVLSLVSVVLGSQAMLSTAAPPSAAPLSNSKQQQPSWLWLGVPDSGAPATARHWWRAQSATAIDLKRSSSIAVGSSVVPCTAGYTGSQRPCGGSDRQAGLHWRGPAVRRYATFETAHLS